MGASAVHAALEAAPHINSEKLSAITDRDWREDFAHENGNYECRCGICEQAFVGHKRRTICKACWEAAANRSSTGGATDRIEAWKQALIIISNWGCETSRAGIGACYREGRRPDAQYLAERCCAPCIANHALLKPLAASRSPEGG